MLLTGFDAPIEQAMYLDKPLRDHNLLQAIARTNRVYPNKGCGKIIDYYGITKNLYDALNFDESIVDSAMIDLDRLKKEFLKILEEIMDIFVGINLEDPSIENLRPVLKFLLIMKTNRDTLPINTVDLNCCLKFFLLIHFWLNTSEYLNGLLVFIWHLSKV